MGHIVFDGILVRGVHAPNTCITCVAFHNGYCRYVQDPYPDAPEYTHPRDLPYTEDNEFVCVPEWCPITNFQFETKEDKDENRST